MAQEWDFWASFPFFSYYFAHVPSEATIHFSAIFPQFRPKVRKQSVAGQRERQVSVLFSSRQSDFRNFNNYNYTSVIFKTCFLGEFIELHLHLHSLNVFELEM